MFSFVHHCQIFFEKYLSVRVKPNAFVQFFLFDNVFLHYFLFEKRIINCFLELALLGFPIRWRCTISEDSISTSVSTNTDITVIIHHLQYNLFYIRTMATDLLGYVLISVVYCNYSMTFLNLFKWLIHHFKTKWKQKFLWGNIIVGIKF